MLYLNCVLTIVLALAINESHSVLADKGKFESLKPSTITSLPDERRSINFKEQPEDKLNKRQHSEDESEKNEDSRQEKKIRTLTGPLIGQTGDKFLSHHCCGSRYEASRPESSQGGSSGGSLKGSSDNGRHPSRYDSRPEDRFGWQSYNPATTGRRGSAGSSAGSGSGLGGSGGGLYGSHTGGDRYGSSRPSYYGDSEYDRPSNSGNRPGRPGYGYGGNGYGDSGAFGSNGFEISRPGGYGGGSRPPSGINFGGGRPGGGSYGGGTYGGTGHGVYGTIGEEDEFPGQDDGAEGGPPPPSVSNLQTQKAVALKALAGVALIGAAAALATNPVLLPIGVLAGRRKRSTYSPSRAEDIDIIELIELLRDHVPKIYGKRMNKEALSSPTCVARLACEVQREYIVQQRQSSVGNGNNDNLYESLKNQLANLIRSKVLHSDVRYKNIRKLLESAEAYEGNCNVFVCDFVRD